METAIATAINGTEVRPELTLLILAGVAMVILFLALTVKGGK